MSTWPDVSDQKSGEPTQARTSPVRGHERIVGRGRASQPGEQRRLSRGEMIGSGVEVERRRGAHAERALAEGDTVEVLLEDRGLGEVPLEAQRPERLRRFRAPPV